MSDDNIDGKACPFPFRLRNLFSSLTHSQQNHTISFSLTTTMDFIFRAATVHPSNHFPSLQASRLHSDKYSMLNYTDEDDDAKSLFQCPFCDFEFDFSSFRARLEEEDCYEPRDMTCPLCEENLGEDAVRVAQNSSKRSWKSDKSSISSGDTVVFDKKLPARGRHELVPDPLLTPFVRNLSVPNSRGIQPSEGFSSSASDISSGKGYDPDISSGKGSETDSGDEEDIEERRQKASFVQELMLSTLF
ncbi:protein DEHYDRATION-INDUCED 19 homolog 5-like isoform X1 [Vigna umbellata]|uniref:protein DEHYDRATION-INDUCED 19 homolog 5-like isoform X1 n=1 Tax=Vigna umbellata TaxID=87088 RepID=UPI001F5FC408|nr:protein DEHYDRATION-INDUCED 19 homolog 5-like isoform X1 [Vigna umbellata]